MPKQSLHIPQADALLVARRANASNRPIKVYINSGTMILRGIHAKAKWAG